MVTSRTTPTGERLRTDWAALARELGPRFAARAAARDAADTFVGARYHALRGDAQRVYSGRLALGVEVDG